MADTGQQLMQAAIDAANRQAEQLVEQPAPWSLRLH